MTQLVTDIATKKSVTTVTKLVTDLLLQIAHQATTQCCS